MRRATVPVVMSVAVLSACTGGGASTGTTGSSSPSATTAGPVATAGPAATAAARPGMGPLENLVYGVGLGAVDPSLPDAAAQLLAEVVEREDGIAACMKEQGFEYTPEVPAMEDVTVDTTGIDRESRQFAEQYGFGAVRQPASWLGNVEYELDASANWDYRVSLSPAAQEAYDDALYGELTSSETSAGGSVTQTRAGGCADVADGGGLSVRDEAVEYLASLPDDAAFDALDGEWSACLREAGFTYESPTAAMFAFFDEYAQTVLADGVVEQGEDDDLAAREAQAGVASWDCRQSLDYDARHRATQDRLEQEWIDAHQAEVDAWLAALDERD